MLDPERLTSNAKTLIATHLSKLPAFLTSAVLKTWVNGWCTTRRFKDNMVKCKFGCEDGNDCIEHYLVCKNVHGIIMNTCGLHATPVSILCLDDESAATLHVRIGCLYALASTYNNIRVKTFRAYWIEACGRSKRTAAAHRHLVTRRRLELATASNH